MFCSGCFANENCLSVVEVIESSRRIISICNKVDGISLQRRRKRRECICPIRTVGSACSSLSHVETVVGASSLSTWKGATISKYQRQQQTPTPHFLSLAELKIPKVCNHLPSTYFDSD